MYTNIIHNDDICNYFLKNQQFIFNSLGNCRECRLSVTQQKILRMIAEKQYINATHAAEILQISRNSVNAVISVLKEKGLIVRIARIKVVTGKLSRDEFVSRI